jgi:hypothetical protein
VRVVRPGKKVSFPMPRHGAILNGTVRISV